jgi:hypothetical protein
MAMVQLADIINVTVFNDLAPEIYPEKTALFESGVVVRDPLADALCAADGLDGTLPYWNDLDPTAEPNYSSDAATTETPLKVAQESQKVRKAFLNEGWSATNLARELAMGADPMRHIRNRLDTFWTRQWQRRIMATLRGVYNNNVASDSSDMVYKASLTGAGTPAASNKFTRAAFTAAMFTMGDRADDLRAIAVHSVTMKQMMDNEDIDFIPDSEGKPTIPTYLGKRVIVDDGSLTFTDNGNPNYISILFGSAAIAYGDAVPLNAIAIERSEAAGHGGGIETLWSRKRWLLHPLGHSNDNATSSGPGGVSQNWSDLALATNWSRTFYRKNVPLAFLVTN